MIRAAFSHIQIKWRNYRHRFVPWIALNLRKNERSLRHVTKSIQDKPIHDEVVSEILLKFFWALLARDRAAEKQSPKTTFLRSVHNQKTDAQETGGEGRRTAESDDVIFQTMGFCVHRMPSSVPLAGIGVFVTKGFVPRGTVVAMYPGTVYEAYEPIFFQSVRNPFVFRCIDGVLVDGNDKGISKLVYKSCSNRDRLGPYRLSDFSWLTAHPKNPLAIGQYVNNCNDSPANVCYQEYDVPRVFPIELHQYLPNVKYSHEIQRPLRCVVLVSLRDISPGEELFSNYYTIVDS